MKKIASSIRVNKLGLDVYLGWSKRERRTKRCVDLTLEVIFSKPPKACKTDDLKDSVCYYKLSELLRKEIGDRSFALIEHLGYEIYHIIKRLLPSTAKLVVTVTKYPAITNLREGVSFSYGDH